MSVQLAGGKEPEVATVKISCIEGGRQDAVADICCPQSSPDVPGQPPSEDPATQAEALRAEASTPEKLGPEVIKKEHQAAQQSARDPAIRKDPQDRLDGSADRHGHESQQSYSCMSPNGSSS